MMISPSSIGVLSAHKLGDSLVFVAAALTELLLLLLLLLLPTS
jgi:hypothetical protein